MDDVFGQGVARRGFRTEDTYPRLHVCLRVIEDFPVKMQNMQ